MASCGTRKGTQASKTSSTQTSKVNNASPTVEKEEKKIVANTPTVKNEEKITTKNLEKGTNVKFVALPPSNVEKTFKNDYPNAADIFWAKENETNPNYKVTFSLAEKNNLLRYSENGTIIETRSEILPEQLPPNVLKSIMAKYPDAKILYVYTYKSTSSEGAYIVFIQTEGKEKEILLLENGNFVG